MRTYNKVNNDKGFQDDYDLEEEMNSKSSVIGLIKALNVKVA